MQANRNRIHKTPLSGPVLCDKELSEGWYRFVGAAGTKMPTTYVPANKCGAAFSGWLHSTHPTVEHDKFLERSALVLFQNVANTKPKFL